MKKTSLSILLVLFFVKNINAQFIFKTDIKDYTNELTGNTFKINGIHAYFIDAAECNISENFKKAIFLEFSAISNRDSTMSFIGQQNVTSDEIISKLTKSGFYNENSAKATVFNVFKNLEYGNKLEKYQAAYTLAAWYNYSLKQISEQEQ